MRGNRSTLGIFQLCVCCILLSFPAETLAQIYHDVAHQKNVRVRHSFPSAFSSGVSCVDFNNDGLDDISLATPYYDSVMFFQNTGSGFIKIPPFVNHTSYSSHLVWVDYDNDGDKDLYISSIAIENRLYRNDSTGFTDVTYSSDLYNSPKPTYGVTWGDYNNDGWLDLYECNRGGRNQMFLSDGAGGFINTSSASGTTQYERYAFAPVFFDYNNDGLQDLFVGNDKMVKSELYLNQGDSTFLEVTDSAGLHYILDAMTATVGDYNNDELLDIYITNSPPGNVLLHNNGNGTFTDTAAAMGVAYYELTWAASFFDYNNDGLQDLYVSEKHQSNKDFSQSLFEHADTAFFRPGAGFLGDTLKSHSHALGDFNNDGHYDIVSPNQAPDSLQLWESNGGGGNWIKVKLEGTVSNRDGIGSRITAYAGTDRYTRYTTCGSGFMSQHSNNIIIGIGSHATVDSLRVKWLSGHTDMLYNLAPAQNYLIKEGSSMTVSLQLSGDSIFCKGDSVQTTITTDNTYHSYFWSTGDTTAILSVKSPGTYHVQVDNEHGLSARSDSITIRMDSLLLSATVAPDSMGTGVGKAQVHVHNGTPPFNFQWDDPAAQTDSVAHNLFPGVYQVVVTDSIGCSDSLSVEVTNPLTIREQALGLHLFPNPTSGLLSISYHGSTALSYRLISAKGLPIQQGVLEPPYKLDLSHLPDGMYSISLLSPSGEAKTLKLLKSSR